MILSTLGLSSHGFFFSAFPLKDLIPIRCYPCLYTSSNWMLSMLISILIDMRHCGTLGTHITILLSNQDFLHCIRVHTLRKAQFSRRPTTSLFWLLPTRLSLNLALIPLVRIYYGPFFRVLIYIGMILSTLDLSTHGFVFGLSL